MKKTLWKKLLALTIGVLMTITFVSCSNSESSKDKANDTKTEKKEARTLDEIKKSGKLILGTNPEAPPFSFIENVNGKEVINGADVMLARKIAEDIGVELEVKKLDYYQLLKELGSGNIDIAISSMKETNDAKEVADFTISYGMGNYISSFIINKGDKKNILDFKDSKDYYNSIEDLKTKTIGVQKGSIQEEILKKDLSNTELKKFNTLSELKKALEDKAIDCAYMEGLKHRNWELDSPDKFSTLPLDMSESMKIDTDNYSGLTYSAAVKKGNSELLKSAENTITKLTSTYDYHKMIKEAQELSNNYNVLGENPKL